MRHPYATLTIFSLAAAGLISITEKGKRLFKEKGQSLVGMMNNMRHQ